MTTMELNLRKTDLFSMINSMDEEDVSMVEKFIKRLRTSKREASYPWNPTDEEFCNTVAESEKEFEKGHYITQNELKSKLQKKLASW